MSQTDQDVPGVLRYATTRVEESDHGPARRRAAGIRDHYGMYIGGEWTEATDGSRYQSIDPTTEGVVTEVPAATRDDVARAVSSAVTGAREWAALGWQGRAAALRELADRIEAHSDDFARIDAVDAGIPVDGMAKDVSNAAATLRYFAGLASEVKGTTIESPAGGMNVTLREPYGVVGRIVPFNHPIQFAASGIAAPLAAGNSVVLKPADATPVSALHLAELAHDLFPPGVLNVVTGGVAAGAALVGHPDVPRIAFTGSIRSGRAVATSAAAHLKAVTLELGGKNPLIVFPDVDLGAAAAAAVTAMNFNRGQGQSCGSPSRILVHESVRAAFIAELVPLVEQLTIGDPLEHGIDMGPLAFAAHYERVLGYVKQGRAEGARLVTGGVRPPVATPAGYFLAPTVFDGVTRDMTIAREEIFGPVVSVIGWRDEAEALQIANELPMGLTANIWTNDLNAALRFGHAIEAGYIWINGVGQRPLGAPFGGYKLSGLGSENSLDELLSFTRTKNLSINPTPRGRL